jgi:hypothetical protein
MCFEKAGGQFQAMLDKACEAAPQRVDTASLTSLWMATIQGSLILYKASGDTDVFRRNFDHVKQYIAGYLPND